MIYCNNCGKQFNEGTKFCKSCGAPLRQNQADNTNADMNINYDVTPMQTASFVPATTKVMPQNNKNTASKVVISVLSVLLAISVGFGSYFFSQWYKLEEARKAEVQAVVSQYVTQY